LLVTSRLGKTEPGKIFREPARLAEWADMFTLRAHIRKIPIVAGTDVPESPVTRDFIRYQRRQSAPKRRRP
ncbi:MAG: hypothetical protein ACRD8U_23410, partial [Pyrinomonadaceae bacterium]